MGWSSGSRIFNGIIDAVKLEVADKEARKRIYEPIIEAFVDQDWDTLDECIGRDEAYDEIYAAMYPEEYYA